MKVKVHSLSFECPTCGQAMRVTFRKRDLTKHKEIVQMRVDCI